MITLLNPRGGGDVGTLILRPNQSMSWTATVLFFATLTLVSLTIAISFLVKGYWLILPFTCLELAIVGSCFYLLARRNRIQQVIEFFPETVQVSIGHEKPEKKLAWQRYFTKIFVNPPRHRWYAPTITLQHRNETIEIGSFLDASEKLELIRHLKKLVQLADQRQVHFV